VAYAAGLHAARLLRLHFPAAFDSLVRDLPVTPAAMHATMELFVNLADGPLFHVDMGRSEFHCWLKDPVAQFPKTLAEGLAKSASSLIESVVMDRDLIWDPTPQIFGLDRNPDNTDPNFHPLAMAIWRLLIQTSLATIREQRPGTLAALLKPGPQRDVVAALAPLPEGTDVMALCEALDARKPNGVAQLGTIIAYAAGMTGNQYADTTYEELLDYYGNYGIDWTDTANLAEIKEAQDEAIAIADAYQALNQRFLKKPKRIATLFRSVQRIATELRRAKPQPPKTLMEIFAPKEPQVDPLGNVYHPIDIGRDIEADDARGIDILGPVYVLSATGPLGGGPPALHHPAGDTPAAPGGGHPAE
jgi:hypothetical protein